MRHLLPALRLHPHQHPLLYLPRRNRHALAQSDAVGTRPRMTSPGAIARNRHGYRRQPRHQRTNPPHRAPLPSPTTTTPSSALSPTSNPTSVSTSTSPSDLSPDDEEKEPDARGVPPPRPQQHGSRRRRPSRVSATPSAPWHPHRSPRPLSRLVPPAVNADTHNTRARRIPLSDPHRHARLGRERADIGLRPLVRRVSSSVVLLRPRGPRRTWDVDWEE